jgi:hypothetical protein
MLQLKLGYTPADDIQLPGVKPMTRLFSAIVIVTVAATAFTASVSSVLAQTVAKPPTCGTLLTADEIAKAIGETFTDMGPRERGQGETECPWMLRGGTSGFKTVAVQFYDLASIKAGDSTLEKTFEQIVSATEGVSSTKREMLPGIGQKAAFVAADPQVLAAVQRADGVARIVGNNLTKAQILAIAQAVAAP